MIQKMCKVEILGSKNILSEVIGVLHSIGTVHIEAIPEKIEEERYLKRVPIERDKVHLKETLTKLLGKIKDILLLLPAPSHKKVIGKMSFLFADIVSDEFKERIDNLYDLVRKLKKDELAVKEEYSSIIRYERILRGFAPIIAGLEDIKHLEVLGITIEKDKSEILPLLNKAIDEITVGSSEIIVKELDEETLGILIIYSREYDNAIRSLLMGENISEIVLPEEYAAISFMKAFKRMVVRKEEIPGQIRAIEDKLGGLSLKWYGLLEGYIGMVEDAIDELSTLEYCAQTRYAFILSGWLPEIDYAYLYSTLMSRFGDKLLIREVDIKEDELYEVPVSIKNPAFIRPFEVFMRIFPPPKYGTIDPTPYLAFFFPVFFGLILGDMGYGLILLLSSIYVRKRYQKSEMIKSIATVFVICAVYSLIFGFLFGEFFGNLGEKFGLHPIIMDRMTAIESFLFLAVAIGIGHVLFGILLSFINYMQRGRFTHALAKALSFVMLTTILLLIAVVTEYLPQGMFTPGLIALIIAFIFLLIFEGILGPLEIIKTIGNMLSYIRIMAIGMASVVMAILANDVGGMSGDILIGIIVAFFIHLINLVIGIFSPTIHALRLHYVEFFGKFYQPGGKEYAPFKKHG